MYELYYRLENFFGNLYFSTETIISFVIQRNEYFFACFCENCEHLILSFCQCVTYECRTSSIEKCFRCICLHYCRALNNIHQYQNSSTITIIWRALRLSDMINLKALKIEIAFINVPFGAHLRRVDRIQFVC